MSARRAHLVSLATPPHKTASVSDLSLHHFIVKRREIEAILMVALHTRHKSRMKDDSDFIYNSPLFPLQNVIVTLLGQTALSVTVRQVSAPACLG